MAEIRLTCPGCSTQYQLPDSAIPPAGREVECTACGNIWWTERPRPPQRTATPLPDAAPAQEKAPLNRPLPDSVLRILRDEVEHERNARAAETVKPELIDLRERPPAAPQPKEAQLPPEEPEAVMAPAIEPEPQPLPASSLPVPSLPAPKHGYGYGFGLAAMIAALAVALYALAPQVAGDNAGGLTQYRETVDAGRAWLNAILARL